MKLHVLSDLHLEVSDFQKFDVDADVIVLAGDISSGTKGIEWASKEWPGKHILYVPGNHEFYNYDRTQMLAEMRQVAIKTGNVHLLDENEFILDGETDSVRFLCCTLWTDFLLFGERDRPWAMNAAADFMPDFRVIHEFDPEYPNIKDPRFTPGQAIALHKHALAWLEAKLAEPFDGKTVVVSHHLPSQLSVSDRYKDNLTSACFASELDHLFGKMDLWIHGHTHDCFDYVSEGTRIVCNPRGYETYQGIENYGFDPCFVVEV